MKVFVTGGTGFIGSGVVAELIAGGHEVMGLARSDHSAQKLLDAGATPVSGSLTDLSSLQRHAAEADAVIHLAYDPNMRNFFKAAKADRQAIHTIAEAIKGTNKPFIITSGFTGIFGKSQKGSEQETPQLNFITRTRWRAEELLFTYTAQGIRTMVIRMPPVVHGEGDRAFTSFFIEYARKNQHVYYIGDGSNIWPAVHRFDAAHLYRLALEKGKSGSVYHAAAEGVPVKQIATTVSKKLNLPLSSASRLKAIIKLSWFSMTVSLHTPANSNWTQKRARLEGCTA
ncbi:SDR family oxidoreductase [Cohnella ginsengisoli]|uniref:SDR family oxidoreductase n=1 Tax=Cohnella ginsengisoli TaxID=425004 RepID=A0A9X4KNF0_9BACL|nr:SDR family oxidoreductase [Cohnella ginsengisoli]MDG0795176.1 SDR family oxidoreductase [Cohnella ginsengisoli]